MEEEAFDSYRNYSSNSDEYDSGSCYEDYEDSWDTVPWEPHHVRPGVFFKVYHEHGDYALAKLVRVIGKRHFEMRDLDTNCTSQVNELYVRTKDSLAPLSPDGQLALKILTEEENLGVDVVEEGVETVANVSELMQGARVSAEAARAEVAEMINHARVQGGASNGEAEQRRSALMRRRRMESDM